MIPNNTRHLILRSRQGGFCLSRPLVISPEVVSPGNRVISPEILVMLPEIKSSRPIFLSLVKISKWDIFRNSQGIDRLKHPSGCVYLRYQPSVVKMSLGLNAT